MLEHNDEGLLNCARIAFDYEWLVDDNGRVYRVRQPKPPKKHTTAFCMAMDKVREDLTTAQKLADESCGKYYFSLDNDSDVLALIKGLGGHGIGALPLGYKWYPSNTKYRNAMPIRTYDTLTDCLYAAAQEV